MNGVLIMYPNFTINGMDLYSLSLRGFASQNFGIDLLKLGTRISCCGENSLSWINLIHIPMDMSACIVRAIYKLGICLIT